MQRMANTRRSRILQALAVTLFGLASTGMAQDFPARDLSGVIQWGPGGATDVVSRALTPGVEQILGRKIVLQNKPGGVGAISTNFVAQQSADGYTLLYGAENPQLHPVLGISNLDYSQFYPINVVARGNVLLVTAPDKPWQSFKDLLAAVQAAPGKLKQGSTGAGGLPFSVNAMVATVTKFPVISVPFEGEGPGVTALLGGHVDFMFVGAGAAAEHIKAGRLKALAVLDTRPYRDIAPITADLPAIGKFLPWGPFYGVFVRNDVPDAAKAVLVKAFSQAVGQEAFSKLMNERGNTMMNLSGDEATAFLKKWQSVTSWTYHEVGVAKKDPADLGIARP